jgi:hypothetical protein
MKTRRVGSIRSWYFRHCVRRRAMSGRSCSAAIVVFFIAELLGTDEVPYRMVVDLQPALGQLRHQSAQREIPPTAPLDEPILMLPPDRLGFVPTHLARSGAAGAAKSLHPLDRAAYRHPKMRRRLMSRHPTAINRRNHSLSQINRIRPCHPCWPPPSQHVESNALRVAKITFDSVNPHPALGRASRTEPTQRAAKKVGRTSLALRTPANPWASVSLIPTMSSGRICHETGLLSRHGYDNGITT